MGQFSWRTSDTDNQVRIYDEPEYGEDWTKQVYVLIPREFQKEFGTAAIFEDKYEGYGVFGGRDVYAMVAQWNRPDECKNADGTWKDDEEIRDIGIGIACYDEDNASLKYPIKIVENLCNYESADPSVSDDDQGWAQEPEEEWD